MRVTYTNAAGEKVLSDDFDPADVGDVFTTFRIDLYPGDNNFADVTVTGEDGTSSRNGCWFWNVDGSCCSG